MIKNNNEFDMQTLSEFFKSFEPKSDKNTGHAYIDGYYSIEFSKQRLQPIKLLEIGIRQGFSHILWEKYFVNGEIWGVDNGESGFTWEILDESKVKVFKEDAYSTNFTNRLPKNYFDYIIEDGSHVPQHQLDSIELYVPLLKPKGKFIIEDVGNINLAKQLETKALQNNLVEFVRIVDLRELKGRWDDIIIEIIRK